jgi:phage anti-repressor protein
LEKDATIMHLQSQVAILTEEVMKWKERHGRVEARESATIEFVQAQMEEQCRKANAQIENSQRRFETKEKSLRLEHAKETALIKQQTIAKQAQQHQIVLDCLLIKHSKEVDLLKEGISTQKAVCN